MCGIAGIWTADRVKNERLTELVRAMTDALAHRGPDDFGTWADEGRGIALGQRRLSIIDLSPEGRQPMVSASGRYVITFNGEVFNYLELQKDLEAASGRQLALRGHSDTETMLAAIEEWGLESAVKRFVGMFAFALWDEERRVLSFVRDRLGIKPLYYGFANGALVFGSELKALTACPELSREIDRSSLASYLRYGYVPAPRSIYAAVGKLEAGCIAEFSAPRADARSRFCYWSAEEIARRGLSSPFLGTEADAIDELERRLEEAVRLRLIADVPVGAFLSGGIDSSTVVALMQRVNGSQVRTFSIANEGAAFDESEAARAVAEHLGTAHTALTVSAEEARKVIPLLPRIYDEPFADSSQIPTFLVSRLARREVTVALSGDGGDEVFGGYNRHVWGATIWRALKRVPLPARRAASGLLLGASPDAWDRLFDIGRGFFPDLRTPGAKLHKLARLLDSESPDDLYRRLATVWEGAERLVPGASKTPARLPDLGCNGASTMMLRDIVTYLPDDILTKVDRASMAVALEARVPLLDHRVVEFAWTLPASLKVRKNAGKWILREVLARHVPRSLFERPKMGFGIPLGDWLRGPLREWASDLLNPDSIRRAGYLVPDRIDDTWRAHLSGRMDYAPALWAVLMFQAWLAAQDA